ncbi:MAG: hypothetical protein NT031_08975 [Planctomycetota bacterium]|nr:hypothetical protein [Planctomycetota bacterium]
MVDGPPAVYPAGRGYSGALVASGTKDAGGNEYLVGYRVFDASGMLNVNYAKSIATPKAGTVMAISDLSLAKYFGLADDKLVGKIHDGAPYLMDEDLAFRGSAGSTTSTGRIKRIVGDAAFVSVGGLAVRSCSRYSLLASQCDVSPMTEKVDLNTASEADLVKAFGNLLSGLQPGSYPESDVLAQILAIRVLDFRSAAGAPRVRTVDTTNYFGLIRQPFITKAAFHRESGKEYYAIELFNPYTSRIQMTGCKLSPGGGSFTIAIDPGKKLVLANNTAEMKVPAAPDTILVSGLNLTVSTAVLWGDGSNFPIGLVAPTDFGASNPSTPLASGEVRFATIRRDDRLSTAAYSVALYALDNSATTGNPVVDCDTGLGKSNGTVVLPKMVAPHPVYVRNDKFINVGDLMRIYWASISIGTAGQSPTPLDKSLTKGDPTVLDNGRLPMLDNPSSRFANLGNNYMANPTAPHGCKAPQFFMVKDSTATNIDTDKKLIYGQINLNTASKKVLMCLPGLAGAPNADARADAVIAKRPYHVAGQVANKVIGVNAAFTPGAYGTSDTNAYALFNNGNDDDGLSTSGDAAVVGDLTKKLAAYAWMSNHITVRSDVFVVYIRVQEGPPNPLPAGWVAAVQDYVGVIDRSMVKDPAVDKPVVVMFSSIN